MPPSSTALRLRRYNRKPQHCHDQAIATAIMSSLDTLPATWARLYGTSMANKIVANTAGAGSLDRSREVERFLAGIERRAFRIAQIALRDVDDALDAVQDAMLQLARRYAHRPNEEWQPLFYRILKNRIRDYQRRRIVRSKVLAWLPVRRDDENEAPDPIDMAQGNEPAPGDRLQMSETLHALEQALHDLPHRQQQVFLLRNFEGLDVAATAIAMGCSEGSVKTHYFRAVHTLRERLGEFWS